MNYPLDPISYCVRQLVRHVRDHWRPRGRWFAYRLGYEQGFADGIRYARRHLK